MSWARSRLWLRRRRKLVLPLAACIALLSLYAIDGSRPPAPAPPAPTPQVPSSPLPAPPATWLGLDYKSGSSTGKLADFSVRGIVYDREGSMEVAAGETVQNAPGFRNGLSTSYAAGMIPDIEMDLVRGPSGCGQAPNPGKLCLPTDETDIESYVRGFIQTATSVRVAYPGRTVLFEPTDEPWNLASPAGAGAGGVAAREYAALLAQLLPAAKVARIPLSDIYVPATGLLGDGTSWITDLYRAQGCLKPGPATCGPIGGWNLHPYGRPHSSSEGIESVPGVRAGMLSGRDNIVVSEIGFCAEDVDGGKNCGENQPDIVGTSSQTAAWLRETLHEAAAMHQAGWLKALLVWQRAGGGWAMQNPDGSLTAQGRALDLFADSALGR